MKSQAKKSFIMGKFTKYQIAFPKTTEKVILICPTLKKRKNRVEKGFEVEKNLNRKL